MSAHRAEMRSEVHCTLPHLDVRREGLDKFFRTVPASDFGPPLVTESLASKLFCVVWPALNIEVREGDVQDAVLPAVRTASRRAKNLWRSYVRATAVPHSTESAIPARCAFTRATATTRAQTVA